MRRRAELATLGSPVARELLAQHGIEPVGYAALA